MAEKKGLNRRDFLKKGLVGLAAAGAVPLAGKAAALTAAKGKGRAPIVRTLGRTGLKIPVVSMGVMNADNPDLVRAALDSGIFMLDTAHNYQRGHNEEMIGQVIKGRPRDSFLLATKVPGPNKDKSMQGLAPEEVRKIFLKNLDVSLERLGLSHVDILYAHNLDNREDALNGPVRDALVEAKKAGKARFIGFSTHAGQPEVIRTAMELKVIDVVLAAYNFRQDNKVEMRRAVAEAAAAGLGIVAMKTQAGAYWDKEKKDPINMTAALKWVLNDPNVTTAIPGFTTFDQLKLDLTVMSDVRLTEAETRDLRLDQRAGGLYCQQCGACVRGCSRALPIPDLMRGYMYAYGYRNAGLAHELLASLGTPVDPCAGCASCSARCVKGFDLPVRIKDISRLRTVPEEFLV